MDVADSPYAKRPWQALYAEGQPGDIAIPSDDILGMFRANLKLRPGAVAVRYFDAQLTYEDLDRLSDAFAAWAHRAGLVAGDRLFVMLQNVPQFFIAALACWKTGAVPVLGNPMYREAELNKLFADCAPRMVLCHPDSLGALVAASAIGASVLTTSGHEFQTRNDARCLPPETPTPAGATDFMTAVRSCLGSAAPDRAVISADLALLLYTSGTTGVPKGAKLTHANLAFIMAATRTWFDLDANSRILAVAPLFHITGFALHISLALASGGSAVLFYRYEPNVALEAMLEHRPTFTIGASTVFISLMNTPGASPEHMASFRAVYSGGAPIPPTLVAEFSRRMGQQIRSSYGMTETTSPTHLAPPGAEIPVDPASGALAIGIPIWNVDAVIVNDQGAICELGEAGELLVRGPQIMAGYWNRPEETAATLAGGWMHTGDIATMDARGWFYLVDRKKDMINASGFKVWPREVEDTLYQHSAVREAAVIGVPDPYRGETVKAFVSLKPGATASPAELVAFAREHLAAYKCPRDVEIVEDLPKTLTGKIRRQALRETAG
jgi:long-chain acyl-CoA synthetase